MTKLLLSGAAGRMGREIAALSAQYGFTVVAGIDVQPAETLPFPLYSSYQLCHEKADLLVDFSRPAHLMQTVKFGHDGTGTGA